MKAIIIRLVNLTPCGSFYKVELEKTTMSQAEVLEKYELVVPVWKHEITFGGLKGIQHAYWGDRLNGLATKIYGGALCDDVIALPENDDELDVIYDEFMKMLKKDSDPDADAKGK